MVDAWPAVCGHEQSCESATPSGHSKADDGGGQWSTMRVGSAREFLGPRYSDRDPLTTKPNKK